MLNSDLNNNNMNNSVVNRVSYQKILIYIMFGSSVVTFFMLGFWLAPYRIEFSRIGFPFIFYIIIYFMLKAEAKSLDKREIAQNSGNKVINMVMFSIITLVLFTVFCIIGFITLVL